MPESIRSKRAKDPGFSATSNRNEHGIGKEAAASRRSVWNVLMSFPGVVSNSLSISGQPEKKKEENQKPQGKLKAKE